MSERQVVLCDIDGVIADLSHRLHFIEKKPADWDGFFEACENDKPIENVIGFVKRIAPIFAMAYVTGRPERVREKTISWFARHGIPAGRLFMRKDGDHREDFIVKLEIFQSFMPRPKIAAVIEDRDKVVEMWRAEGLLCLQPKKGDY